MRWLKKGLKWIGRTCTSAVAQRGLQYNQDEVRKYVTSLLPPPTLFLLTRGHSWGALTPF